MKNKKLLSIFTFSLAVMISGTLSFNVNAEVSKDNNLSCVTTDDNNDDDVQKVSADKLYTYNNLSYTIENNNITINCCNDYNVKSLSIPSTINGRTVTKIDEIAFLKLKKLQSVSIPGTVEEIGKGAFGQCINLNHISIGYGVKKISAGSFAGCEALQEIYIPDSVTVIGKGAFGQCSKLNKITICNKDASIGKAAFNNYEEEFYKSMNGKYLELLSSSDSDIDISQYDKYKLSNSSRTIYGFDNSSVKSFATQEKFNFVKHNVCVVTSTHVQNVGWQDETLDGELAGTQGRGLRLEGIKMRINGDDDLGISYNTQIQNIGWQGFKNDWDLSGTQGRSLRLEAIRIQLTGKNKDNYDVYYSVHSQNYGWLGWAKNGEISGTEGMGLRLEAIKVVIVNKGGKAPGSLDNAYHVAPPKVNYKTHVQDYGWQNLVRDGATSGTVGKSKRLEGIMINLSGLHDNGGIRYRTHVQNIGWQNFSYDGDLSGTTGKSYRLEAICIELTGDVADKYDIYYRVHSQNYGWLGWAKNGNPAGTSGKSLRLEGIQIKVVEKGSRAPGSTDRAYIC